MDLHCHTKLSDGSIGIDELIYLATKLKINTISVTDHDTFAGAKRAKIIGQRYGINVIMGAEISSFDKSLNKEIHILCYMCDTPDRLEGLFKRIGEGRQKAAAEILQHLMKFYPISPEMVSKKAQGSTNIFRNHIIQAVMDIGYPLPHGVLSERLFNKHFNLLSIDYGYPDVSEVIDQIHESGGIAVLAHPKLSGIIDSIENFIELGLDGIEVWHPSADKDTICELESIAIEHSLVMTGGSDFHGMYSPYICPLGTCTMPEDKLHELEQRKNNIYKKI